MLPTIELSCTKNGFVNGLWSSFSLSVCFFFGHRGDTSVLLLTRLLLTALLILTLVLFIAVITDTVILIAGVSIQRFRGMA